MSVFEFSQWLLFVYENGKSINIGIYFYFKYYLVESLHYPRLKYTKMSSNWPECAILKKFLFFRFFFIKQTLFLSNKMLKQINIFSLPKKNVLNRLWKLILFALYKGNSKNKVLTDEWILITFTSKPFFPKL